jgi:hypothetical protein
MPVNPVGLTTAIGSSGVYTSNATTDRIVVVGYFVDNTQQPLMDTTLYKK